MGEINTGDIVLDVNGITWRTGTNAHGELRWTSITSDESTSTVSPTPPEGYTIVSSGTSSSSLFNSTDLGYPNDYDGLDKEEEISEEVQEKINKIGTPGKRNIDDLLNSFKVVEDSKKGAPLEELDDGTWMDKVMNMTEETDTFVPASDDPVTEAPSMDMDIDIRMETDTDS